MAKKGKVSNYKVNKERYDDLVPYHRIPSTLLDRAEVENIYTRDLTDPDSAYEKQGFKPTWSRYTTFGEKDTTFPREWKKDHEKDHSEEDYRDRSVFTKTYR